MNYYIYLILLMLNQQATTATTKTERNSETVVNRKIESNSDSRKNYSRQESNIKVRANTKTKGNVKAGTKIDVQRDLESRLSTHIIINAKMHPEEEKRLKNLGNLIYRIPMIDSYVLEVPKDCIKDLKHVEGVEQVEYDALMTAQMDIARKVVKTDTIRKNYGYTGKGITVAVIDTGVHTHKDFMYPQNRLLGQVDYLNGRNELYDDSGHGTHVAGIVGGSGYASSGKYTGIAPEVNLLSVKVLDAKGGGKTSDVLAGLQWIMDHRRQYNIRIVNISIGGKDELGEEAAIVKAVNKLWDAGIVVVTAAGNKGPRRQTITTPGISRKIITVGSSDDQQTVNIKGDYISNYSSRGPTKEKIIKPDVVAPGANIISCSTQRINVTTTREEVELGEKYESKSGTSMSAPIVTGAIALLLQKEPDLTPNQVKLRLSQSCEDLGFEKNHQGWGQLNIEKLLKD